VDAQRLLLAPWGDPDGDDVISIDIFNVAALALERICGHDWKILACDCQKNCSYFRFRH
jgi:hypothetical protein